MKSELIAATLFVASAATGASFLLSSRATASSPAAGDVAKGTKAQADDSLAGAIALGEHLVKTAGCHDCHTPLKLGPNGPEPDTSRALSGHPEQMKLPPAPPPSGPWIVAVSGTNTAWSGPWGTSFTANLTPDKETGLGTWTRDTFIQTIRTGRHMGRGRPVLPPMPIGVYRNFSDAELGAIYAYLHSLPPMKNRVPDPLPPAPAPAH